MFKFRSVSSIVIALASTGKDKSNKIAVISTDQINKANCFIFILLCDMLNTVDMKLMAPKIDLIPAMCSEKIAISTAGPLCPLFDDKGGYTVHPVPTPPSTVFLAIIIVRDGGINQKLMLFIRG